MYKLTSKYRLHYIFLCSLILFMVYERLRLIISYSIDLDGLEYMFIHYIQNIIYHKDLYCSSDVFPSDTCIHMPLYPYLMASIFRLFHSIDPNITLTEVNGLYKQLIICRALSFAFLGVSLYYIIKTLWLFNREKFITLFTICFVMLFFTGHFYAARQDAMKTAFFIMLVYYAILFLQKGNYKHLVLFSLLVILAICTKQDIIIYLGEFIVVCVLVARSKRSLMLPVIFLIAVTVIYLFMWQVFGYKFIENSVLLNFQVNISNINTYNFFALLFSVLRSIPFLILLIWFHIKNKEAVKKDSALSILIFFAYISYITSHLLILRASSYINYTHEAMAYMMITLGALSKFQRSNKNIIALSFIMGILLLFSDMATHTYSVSNKKEAFLKKRYAENLQLTKTIDTIIGNQRTFFLTSDYTVYYPQKNLAYGYDLHIDRFVHAYLGFETHSRLLFLNSRKYDAFFYDGSIPFIIADDNKFSRKIMGEDFPQYKSYKQAGHLLVFRYPSQ